MNKTDLSKLRKDLEINHNMDVRGVKDYINEWLTKKNLITLFGAIEKSDETEPIIPAGPLKKAFGGSPISYKNKQYIEWLSRVYSKLSIDRSKDQGIFFWFKPYERAIEILKEKKLHLLSLEKMDMNDHSEALEFIQRYGYFPYSERNSHFSTPEKKHLAKIACFTRNFREQKFWNDYAIFDTGISLGLRIKFKNNPHFKGIQLFNFRDVFYDTGYDLDFLNELRYLIFKEFNVMLSTIPKELKWMIMHYKRDKYRWENETRLSFDFDKFFELYRISDKTENMSIIERLTSYGIEESFSNSELPDFLVKVAFDNPFFEIKLCEIICGSQVSEVQIAKIKEIVSDKEVLIWKR